MLILCDKIYCPPKKNISLGVRHPFTKVEGVNIGQNFSINSDKNAISDKGGGVVEKSKKLYLIWIILV